MPVSTIGIIILVTVTVIYASGVMPLSVGAILSCLAMGIFGCCGFDTVFSGFGSTITMMVAGMMVVGDTLFATGAAQYLGSKLVGLFGQNEKRFLLASVVLTAVISGFLNNSATVAMMLPIMGSAISASKGVLTKKHTYMPIGFAAVAGGGLTLIGTPCQLIAQGMLVEKGYAGASFFEYLSTGLPKVIILVVFISIFGYKMIKRICDFPEVENTAVVQEDGPEKFTWKMLVSILILVFCVVGFVTQIWPVGIVAMLGASLCIVTRCVTAKQVYKTLEWESILIVGGTLGFASCLEECGAGQVIADWAVRLIGSDAPQLVLLIVIAVLASVMGNLLTSSATTAILAPIVLFMAPELGANPRSLVIAVAVFSSITFCTPVSTPPNTLPLVAGYRYSDYVRVGGLLNLIMVAIIIAIFPLFYSLGN